MIQMLIFPISSQFSARSHRSNTIFRPSGEISGIRSRFPVVSTRTPPRVGSTDTICGLPPFADENRSATMAPRPSDDLSSAFAAIGTANADINAATMTSERANISVHLHSEITDSLSQDPRTGTPCQWLTLRARRSRPPSSAWPISASRTGIDPIAPAGSSSE